MTFEQVIALIQAFTELWPNSDYGPAHIVLSDGNLADDNIDFCLAWLDEVISGERNDIDADTFEIYLKSGSEAEWHATRYFLLSLKQVPEEIRDAPTFGTECPQCGQDIWTYTPAPPDECPHCGYRWE